MGGLIQEANDLAEKKVDLVELNGLEALDPRLAYEIALRSIVHFERFKAEHSLSEIENATTLQWALRYGIIGRLYGFLEALDIFRSYAVAIREALRQ